MSNFLELIGFVIAIGVLEVLINKFGSQGRTRFSRKFQNDDENETVKDEIDPLKIKGDEYEKVIGLEFEKKGDLVIYNGLIQGYKDGGVDVVSISEKNKTINLIQCKNWTFKTIQFEHIETIYEKLDNHSFDFLLLDDNSIMKFLQLEKDISDISGLLTSVKSQIEEYTVRKILYASSDKVVDLNIGNHLTMIKPNIFRYEDMKIVFYND